MSDLSLTGKTISPIQGTRSYSARSSRSSAGDNRRTTAVYVPKASTSTRLRRPKPEMAVTFPKQTKPSPRTIKIPRATSSTEYLQFFDNPQTNTKNARNLYSNRSSVESRNSNIYAERDRSQPSINSENKDIPHYHKPYSEDLPKYKPRDNLADNSFERSRSGKLTAQVDSIKHGLPKVSTLKKREDSAIIIQKWYRRHFRRAKSSEAALKRMLQQKKIEMEGTMQEEKLQTRQRTEEEKRKQRREREREERRKAIAELQKSRGNHEKKYKAIVDEEMAAIASKRRKHQSSRLSSQPPVTPLPPALTDSQVVKTVEDKIEKLFEETRAPSEQTHSDCAGARSQDDESIPEELPESQGGSTTAKSSGLLESLLETIQQLEAEPEQLVKAESSSKLDEKLAWIDEMQSDYLSSVSDHRGVVSSSKPPGGNWDGAGDSTDHMTKHVPSTNADSLMTKAKLTNLMNFLDNVEKQEEEYKAAKFQISRVPNAQSKDVSESEKFVHLVEAEKAASEVTTELLKLRLDVDEKTKSVDLLKKALSQQRELTVRHSQEQEKEMNQRLKMQKEQYESTIKRHLSFIDQLIDDKKVLHEKCERVVLEMKQSENKYQKKIRELQEAHAVEVKKQKEVLSAAEKLRREKWIEEKTRKIKEMTVKGLEPEIQRLIAKHKQEVKKVKAIHEAQLLQSDERAGQRYIRQTEELREHLEREKEAACNREREMARQRYEKQLEQEEMALQQQRRRLYAEVADEKERLNEQAARQRADIDRLKEQLEKHNSLATSALTEEYKKSKHEAERRHLAEIETLKERLELEKQAWQETYMKKQEAYILQKERELKDAVRNDRDAEIETVIEQLEKDLRVQRDQIEKTAENRIKRIREKYESELKEIEALERQTQEKYNNTKVQFSDMEGENMRLQSTVAQKDQEILDIKKVKDRLVKERGNVSDIIREEFAERLVHTEEENKRMKNDIAQMRARHRLELDRVNQEKEEELTEVHKRVKAAIVKKEEALAQIKQQYEAAVKRADHLEGLLEAQRKQLLARKK